MKATLVVKFLDEPLASVEEFPKHFNETSAPVHRCTGILLIRLARMLGHYVVANVGHQILRPPNFRDQDTYGIMICPATVTTLYISSAWLELAKPINFNALLLGQWIKVNV